MTITRVRIISPYGEVFVLDKTWSQIVELLSPLSEAQKKTFWAYNSVQTQNWNYKLVKENV